MEIDGETSKMLQIRQDEAPEMVNKNTTYHFR